MTCGTVYSETHVQHYVTAGDCRAVLGQYVNNPGEGRVQHPLADEGALLGPATKSPVSSRAANWRAVDLSLDHNAREPREQDRLAQAHPDESGVVRENHPGVWYVRGRLQPTRALGDLYLKYGELNGKPRSREWGRYLAPPHTPPYITATPETRVHTIDPKQDAFVILACDGVWDVLTSDEAVGIVAQHAGSYDSAADALVTAALAKAAAQAHMSPQQLAGIGPGRSRRSLVDDLTVVVLWLDTAAAQHVAGTPSRLSQQAAGQSSAQRSLWSWLFPSSSGRA